LFINENEDAAFLLPFTQKLHQAPKLVIFFKDLDGLLNILGGLATVADDDFNWMNQY